MNNTVNKIFSFRNEALTNELSSNIYGGVKPFIDESRKTVGIRRNDGKFGISSELNRSSSMANIGVEFNQGGNRIAYEFDNRRVVSQNEVPCVIL